MEASVNSEDVRILIDPLNLPRKINCDNHENFSLVDKNVSFIKDKKCGSFEKLSSRENKEISDFLNAIEKPSEKFDLKKEFYAEPVPVGSRHQFNENEEADVRHRSGVFPHSWAPLGPSPSSGLGRHRSQHKFQKFNNLKKNPLSVTEGMVYTIPDKCDHNASSKSFQLPRDKKTQRSLKNHLECPEKSGPVHSNHRRTDEIAPNAKANSVDKQGSGDGPDENSYAVVPDGRRTSADESKRGLLKLTNQSERGGSSVKVAFFLGADDMEAGGEAEAKLASEVASPSKGPKISRKHGGRHKSGSRVFGSEVLLESSRHVRSEEGGGDDLDDVHRNVMTSHRFDNAKGLRHRKVDRKSFAARRDSEPKNNRRALVVDLPEIAAIPEEDDIHHKMFVELDELRLGEGNEWEWRERARWIKFEEEVEEGACRWGKPHVSSLSFHSLVELRRCIEHGAVVLDLDADDLPTIMSRVADQLVITDQLTEDKKPYLLQILLLKHKHMYEQQSFIKRTQQLQNLSSLVQSQNALQSLPSVVASDGDVTLRLLEHDVQTEQPVMKESKTADDGKNVQEMSEEELDFNKKESCVPALCGIEQRGMTQSSSSKSLPSSASSSSPFARKYSTDVPHILKRIPLGAEATNVLVGPAAFLDKPVTVFVRLRNAVCLNSVTEVPLPVRFLFLLLGPDDNLLDYHEIGRSLSTLMADGRFHDAAYVATNRSDILDSLNEFLNDSIVLPPGEWDKKTLLPIVNITKEKQREKKNQKVKKVKDHPAYDPLKRTGRHFGGLIEDVKHRYPYYWSDIRDGLNLQCLAAFFFVYFACLSPAITFGGLLGEKTDKLMGVNEMLVATAICGVVFSLAAGQPLVIIGATGPVLVFEEALFKICHAFGLEFLPFRVWVSIWVSIITLFGVMWECSVLVRFITRFTEEVFALLISLIFIYEVFKKLFYIFHKNPLLEFYLPQDSGIANSFLCSSLQSEFADFLNVTNNSTAEVLHLLGKSAESNSTDISPAFGVNMSLVDVSNNRSFENFTSLEELRSSCRFDGPKHLPHPNTAFFSVILTFGTFLLAYALKAFRNSKFLGRNARRAIGDFGVPISIFIVALTDYFTPNTYTEKLDVPEGFSPTASSKRSWFINPLGVETTLPLWSILAAAIPSVLIFILLYMESVITSMIVNKKDRCLKKGSGYHLDLFVTGMCATICGFLGLPFMCSATVRSVTHVSALAVFSRTHAPGDKPHLVRVHEQRLTSLAVHLLVGVSVLMGPVLSNVPTAVLFGIFLYMGIASMSGIQLLKRLKLMFMPVKHHPDVGYVKKVRLWKMNLFTCLQLIFLAVLWVVKSSKGALAFPFILILIIPVRIHLFKFIFSERELRELDNEEDCTSDDEQDEPDFYTQAHMPM